MPRRKGILRRIADGIGRVLGIPESEPVPRTPPEPPEREPPRRPGPDTPPPEIPERERIRREFREVWDETIERGQLREIQSKTGHSEREIFNDTFDIFFPQVTEESQDIRLAMYENFLVAFYNDDPTYTKRDFFTEYDIAPSSFAWEYWRESRGYPTK